MEFDKTSDYFTAFRKTYGFPNFYREQPLDWFREVGMWGVGVAYITTVLAMTVIIAFLGTRGYSRWRIGLQMIVSLGIGFSIVCLLSQLLLPLVLGNTNSKEKTTPCSNGINLTDTTINKQVCVSGVNWQTCEYELNEVGHIFKYKVHIGLHQANITMAKMAPTSSEYSEYHNLKIGWFDVFQAEQEYREALRKGWPVGILRVARYITADFDSMRYMRKFRWSGYAAWILLWTAAASWLLSNVLMGAHISYSALFLLFTGILQLLACIVYDCQTAKDFLIPMDDNNGNSLRLRYGWMYWVTLFMGIFVILMAAIILILDYLRPADMNKFFGTTSEIHSPYDEELTQNQNKDIKGMIRSLSQKKVRADYKRQPKNDLDTDRDGNMPFHIYGKHGTDNPAYVTSMTSIHEGDEGNSHIEVPEIHVEMVDINSAGDPECAERADNSSREMSHHRRSSSEITCESELSEANGSVRPCTGSCLFSTGTKDKQLLSEDDDP